jgi:hypothetical protein
MQRRSPQEAAVLLEPPELLAAAGVSVGFPEARWATAAEVDARGWGQHIGGGYGDPP